jgi:hypothetical protein
MKTMMVATVLGGLLALPAAASEMGQFDWLSGAWCGSQGDGRIEEHWTASASNGLLGMARTVHEGRMVSFEYMRIETGEQTPRFVAQPGGAAPTAFALQEHQAMSVRFHNPQHDFPQTVRYWREGAALHAEISGPDGDGGLQRMAFVYHACAPTSAD